MRKPENFEKIDCSDITVGHTGVRIDVSKDGFFAFGDEWKNTVLFEMNWHTDEYNVKICAIGDGVDGWYLHEKLPIPKSLMKTLSSFKEFVSINILDVAKNVNLMNRTPNTIGVTELTAIEKIHSVPSSSGPNLLYEVTENVSGIKDEWSCTCPAFMYSKATPQICKHIIQLKP